MANEAVIIELNGLGGNPIRYTVANGTAISAGVLCKLTDPRTAAASSADSDTFAGIMSEDKEASDGAVSAGLYTSGIFDLTCGPAVTLGARVSLSGANLIKNATEAEIALGKDIGVALETGSAGEVIAVLVNYP